MNCLKCAAATEVLDSRIAPANTVRRRRECKACKARYTTYEREEFSDPATEFAKRLLAIRGFARMTVRGFEVEESKAEKADGKHE